MSYRQERVTCAGVTLRIAKAPRRWTLESTGYGVVTANRLTVTEPPSAWVA